ncbi:MAG: hypothetical protein WC947_04715 [Elusimicrobiota bacterium]
MFRVIVMAFACLSIVGCNKSEIDRLQKENVQLKEQVQSLQTEITKLKETADFHFQSGVDSFNSENYTEAEISFNNVVEKYPTSPLVISAKQQLTKVKTELAKIEAQRIAEEKRLEAQRRVEEKERRIAEERERRKREELERLQGTPINYVTFYSKAGSGGLSIGKRYRFKAGIWSYGGDDLALASFVNDGILSTSHRMVNIEKDFDDILQLEHFLKYGSDACYKTITASMGWNGRVYIHRIE